MSTSTEHLGVPRHKGCGEAAVVAVLLQLWARRLSAADDGGSILGEAALSYRRRWAQLRVTGAPLRATGGGARLWVVVGSERWGSKWRGLREAETAPTGTMRYSSSGGGGFKMRELRTAGLL
ncbi:hypothetical protein GUJ93_ZPchr0009g108 [Zizania palustris]|uniref:Uncharacterized protein n=1 Tax=Zizania palustris TaxID=103762 RepID=A0A8J5UXH4_ZIZPA|nr:hypothetical protein GUJ93_ZPchr0009g108 [Zizania palustris]